MANFQALFHPRSVVFVGASNKPGKWGSIVLANLMRNGFNGEIFPVNPGEAEVQGLKAYARIADVPGSPDLAAIVVPPPAVPGVIDECTAKGIRAGVVITAGFAEVGRDGLRLQEEMVDRARAGGMILVGPNCNGIISPPGRLHLAMPPVYPAAGTMAVIGQSGNVATSIARRIMKLGFGLSRFVSSGNEADLHCEDYFRHLAEDPETRVILSYVEGFRDGARFLRIAREVTARKPLLMLKAGGTGAGARAAMSHTASLAGSDAAFRGAVRQAGVIRARNMDDMVNMALGLARQPLPRGRRVGIVTAGGGWGVLAADACARAGLDVVDLPADTLAELDAFMPAWWNPGNPVDLVAALKPDHLWKSLEGLLRCPVVDGVIMLGIMPALPWRPLPPKITQEEIKERLSDFLAGVRRVFERFDQMAETYKKPVVVASEIPVVGPDLEARMAEVLGPKGYVCYQTPEDAATVMAALADYAEYLRDRN